MRLFRRRRSAFDLWARADELGPPDWSRVEAQYRLFDSSRQLGAVNGWFVDTPWSKYGSDQPCTVFLSMFGLYVDVRPDASVRVQS